MSKTLFDDLVNEPDPETVQTAITHFTLAKAALEVSLAFARDKDINGVAVPVIEIPACIGSTLLGLIEASQAALNAALKKAKSNE
jgi:hypothetical protein